MKTIEQRRADACLCLFYRIVYGIVAIPMPDYIQPSVQLLPLHGLSPSPHLKNPL